MFFLVRLRWRLRTQTVTLRCCRRRHTHRPDGAALTLTGESDHYRPVLLHRYGLRRRGTSGHLLRRRAPRSTGLRWQLYLGAAAQGRFSTTPELVSTYTRTSQRSTARH